MSERNERDDSDGEALLREALAQGREEAFEQVYERFAPELLRAAASASRAAAGRSHAEDAVQEAFVGLVRSGARVRDVRDLRAYLITAAIRAAQRLAQAGTRGFVRLEADLSREAVAARSAAAEHDGVAALERELRRLPLEQREAVLLHIDGGLTFEEIGAALEISAATAASRYRYALEKLRAGLGAETNTLREAPDA